MPKRVKRPPLKHENRSKVSTHSLPTSSLGAWLTNAGKSIGFSAWDIIQQSAPATIDTITSASELLTDFRDSLQQYEKENPIRGVYEKSAYKDVVDTARTNLIDSLKTGKFYDPSKEEIADDFDLGDDFDFGDWDVDDSFGEVDLDGSDGFAEGSVGSEGSDGSPIVNNVKVSVDIGEGSPLVQAVQTQSQISSSYSAESIAVSKKNHMMMINEFNNLGTKLDSHFGTINDNISTIAKVLPTITEYTAASVKYYSDSMEAFNRMNTSLDELKTAIIKPVQEANEKSYMNVLDIFSSNGSLDVKEYAKLVKKQFGSAVDRNLILSSLKNMGTDTDVLKQLAKNPLKNIPNIIAQHLIPGVVQQTMQAFDETLSKTSIAGLYRVGGLKSSDNPILNFIGQVFGIDNKLRRNVDRSKYNRDVIGWDGESKKTLVEVIPYYLRKMTAALTGTQEVGFNYESGTFGKVGDFVKSIQDSDNRKLLGNMTEALSDFKEFIEQNMAFKTDRERDNYGKAMESFLRSLVTNSEGGQMKRTGKGANASFINAIAKMMGSNTHDPTVQAIAAFFDAAPNAYVMSMFGENIIDARASMTKFIEDIEKGRYTTNRMYTNAGFTVDDHLKKRFDKIINESNTKSHNVGGNVDKFHKTNNDYLRDIFKLLSTGIRVYDVRGGIGTTDEKNSRVQSIIDHSEDNLKKIKTSQEEYNRMFNSDERHYKGKTYSQEEIKKLVKKGYIDTTTDEGKYQAIKARSGEYFLNKNGEEQKDAEWFMKLTGLNDDQPLSKVINFLTRASQKPGATLANIFRKSDEFLFSLVFGGGEGIQKGFFGRAMTGLKGYVASFAGFLNNKIFKPLQEALFGEDGLINQIKDSQLGQSVKNAKDRLREYMFGKLDPDTQVYSGGLFSDTANELKEIGKSVKDSLVGPQETSVLSNIKSLAYNITDNIRETLGFDKSDRVKKDRPIQAALDSIWTTVKNRVSGWMDDAFGPEDPNGENRRRKFLNDFKNDMSGKGGKLAAGAIVGGAAKVFIGGKMGFLGSLLLPGGFIGGALMGLGVTIVKESETIKKFLFGELDDETGRRQGGVISKKFIDAYENNKFGIKVGALGGLAATFGIIPAFLIPGGPIGGALLGGAASIAYNLDEVQDFLFGPADETGHRMSGTGILGKVKKKFDETDMKSKFVTAGIGAGVGLLGSFFIPGGPILNAAMGAAAAIGLSTDRFKNFMFGDWVDENDHSKGRQGGLLGKVFEKVTGPVTTAIKMMQVKFASFIERKMIAPLSVALKPITTELNKIKDRVVTFFKGISDAIKEHIINPVADSIKTLLSPINRLVKFMFTAITTAIGTVIASPFKVLELIGLSLNRKHMREGERSIMNSPDGHLKNSLGANIIDALKYIFMPEKMRQDYRFGPNGAFYNKMRNSKGMIMDSKAELRMKRAESESWGNYQLNMIQRGVPKSEWLSRDEYDEAHKFATWMKSSKSKVNGGRTRAGQNISEVVIQSSAVTSSGRTIDGISQEQYTSKDHGKKLQSEVTRAQSPLDVAQIQLSDYEERLKNTPKGTVEYGELKKKIKDIKKRISVLKSSSAESQLDVVQIQLSDYEERLKNTPNGTVEYGELKKKIKDIKKRISGLKSDASLPGLPDADIDLPKVGVKLPKGKKYNRKGIPFKDIATETTLRSFYRRYKKVETALKHTGLGPNSDALKVYVVGGTLDRLKHIGHDITPEHHALGGRIRRTGLHFLHRGETVIPSGNDPNQDLADEVASEQDVYGSAADQNREKERNELNKTKLTGSFINRMKQWTAQQKEEEETSRWDKIEKRLDSVLATTVSYVDDWSYWWSKRKKGLFAAGLVLLAPQISQLISNFFRMASNVTNIKDGIGQIPTNIKTYVVDPVVETITGIGNRLISGIESMGGWTGILNRIKKSVAGIASVLGIGKDNNGVNNNTKTLGQRLSSLVFTPTETYDSGGAYQQDAYKYAALAENETDPSRKRTMQSMAALNQAKYEDSPKARLQYLTAERDKYEKGSPYWEMYDQLLQNAAAEYNSSVTYEANGQTDSKVRGLVNGSRVALGLGNGLSEKTINKLVEDGIISKDAAGKITVKKGSKPTLSSSQVEYQQSVLKKNVKAAKARDIETATKQITEKYGAGSKYDKYLSETVQKRWADMQSIAKPLSEARASGDTESLEKLKAKFAKASKKYKDAYNIKANALDSKLDDAIKAINKKYDKTLAKGMKDIAKQGESRTLASSFLGKLAQGTGYAGKLAKDVLIGHTAREYMGEGVMGDGIEKLTKEAAEASGTKTFKTATGKAISDGVKNISGSRGLVGTMLETDKQIFNVAKTAVKEVPNAARKLAGTSAGKTAIKVAKTVSGYNTAATIGNAVGNTKAGQAIKTAATKVTSKATGEGGILTSIVNGLERCGTWISDKAGTAFKSSKGLATKISTFFKGLVSKLKTPKALKFITKYAKKFSAAIFKGTFLSAAFGVFGVVDGAASAANMFELGSDSEVDSTMKIIAGIIGGLKNVGPGVIFDIANTIITSVTNFNPIKELATLIYNLVSSDEEKEALKASQEKFDNEYTKKLDSELAAYAAEHGGGKKVMVNKLDEDGNVLVDENGNPIQEEAYEMTDENGNTVTMTVEEFQKKGLGSSRADLNAQINQTLTSKIATGAANVAKFGKNASMSDVMSKIGDENYWNDPKRSGFSKVMEIPIELITVAGKTALAKIWELVKGVANIGKGLGSGFKAMFVDIKGIGDVFTSTYWGSSYNNEQEGPGTGEANGMASFAKIGESAIKLLGFPIAMVVGLGKSAFNLVSKIFGKIASAAGAFSEQSKNSLSNVKGLGDVFGAGWFDYKAASKDDPENPVDPMKKIGWYAIQALTFPAAVFKGIVGSIEEKCGPIFDPLRKLFKAIKEGVEPKEDGSSMTIIGRIAYWASKIFELPGKLITGVSETLSNNETIKSIIHNAGNMFKFAVGTVFSTISDDVFSSDYWTSSNYINIKDGPFHILETIIFWAHRALSLPIALPVGVLKKLLGALGDIIGASFMEGNPSFSEIMGFDLISDEKIETSTIKDIWTKPNAVTKDNDKAFSGVMGNLIFTISRAFVTIIWAVKRIGLALKGPFETVKEFITDTTQWIEDQLGSDNDELVAKQKKRGYIIANNDVLVLSEDTTTKVENAKTASSKMEKNGYEYITIDTGNNSYYTGWILKTEKQNIIDRVNTYKKNGYIYGVYNVDGEYKRGWKKPNGDKFYTEEDLIPWTLQGDEYIQETGSTYISGHGSSSVVPAYKVYGGNGVPQMINGFPYYSQNDPSFKDKPYRTTNGFSTVQETMGARGCGPTAMSMVATALGGNGDNPYSPLNMANYATQQNFSNQYGTTPGYFNAMGSQLGMNVMNSDGNVDNIRTMLTNGQPVIIQGASNDSMSPYTSSGHYVVAVGIDHNGHILVNDPRGAAYSKPYTDQQIQNGAVRSWGFSNSSRVGGYGGTSGMKSNKRIFGGFGTSTYYGNYYYNQGDAQWGSMKLGSLTMSGGGCIVASFAMAISNALNKPITPKQLLENARSSIINGSGSFTWSNAIAYAKALGITCYDVGNDIDTVKKAVDDGKAIVFYGTKGSGRAVGNIKTSSTKHCVYIAGLSSEGKVLINDPGWQSRNGEYDKSCLAGLEHALIFPSAVSSSSTVSSTSDSSSSSSTTEEDRSISGYISKLTAAYTEPINEYLYGKSSSSDTTVSEYDTGEFTQVSGGDNSLAGNANTKKIWDFFTNLGYSKAATAGILGNIWQESKADPTAVQKSGKAAGLFQWESYTPVDKRFAALDSYAKSKGKLWSDLVSQLEYANMEMTGSLMNKYLKDNAGTTYDAWKQSTNVKSATEQFEKAFERATIPRMESRVSAANAYYDLYAGGNGLGGFGGSTSRVRNTGNSYYRDLMAGGNGYINGVDTNGMSNEQIIELLTSMLGVMRSTDSGISSLNDKELSVNTPVIYADNSTTVNSNNIKQQKSKLDSTMVTSENYQLAKKIAKGEVAWG